MMGQTKHRLIALAVAVGVLHLAGIGLLTAAAVHGQLLFGLGGLAYLLGVRHAFDIDHIATIDNVTRKLSHDRGRPIFVGFAFSLGHSTVVLGLCVAMLFTFGRIGAQAPWFAEIGVLVSASFLTVIALFNLTILGSLISRRRGASHGGSHDAVERLLERRGLFSRLLGRGYRQIDASWKLYPLGVLFGLGFDTATEIAVLGMSAVAIQQGILSGWMILAFPLLFAAGMTLMDSANGLLMLRAYAWGDAGAERRLSFNIVMTGLSVALALLIAGLQWTQLATDMLAPDSGVAEWLAGARVDVWGAAVLAAFLLLWAATAGYQKYLVPLRSR